MIEINQSIIDNNESMIDFNQSIIDNNDFNQSINKK